MPETPPTTHSSPASLPASSRSRGSLTTQLSRRKDGSLSRGSAQEVQDALAQQVRDLLRDEVPDAAQRLAPVVVEVGRLLLHHLGVVERVAVPHQEADRHADALAAVAT